jgi:long-subunit fatty acid transport protein
MRRGLALLVVLIGLLSAAGLARAGGFTMTSFGARRNGMLANLAFLDDGTALFHNPAGLADRHGVRFHASAGFALIEQSIKMRALDPSRFAINTPECGLTPPRGMCWPVDGLGYYVDPIAPERTFGVMPALSASTDLSYLGSSVRGLVVGLGLHTPNLYGAYLPESAPSSFLTTGGMFLVIATTAGVGYRVNKHIAVGASLSYNYMTLSMARRISVLDALTPAGESPSATAQVGQQLLGDLRLNYSGSDHGFGWHAGFIVDPFPWLTLSAGYVGALAAMFRGSVTFQALGALVQDPADLPAILQQVGYKLPKELQLEIPIPHSLQLGIGLKPASWIEIAVDLRFWFYQVFDFQTVIPIYDPSEPGKEPLTTENLSRDKRYRLSYQLTAGLLVRPFRHYRQLELMAGVGFDKAPIPDETFTLDSPSLTQIRAAVGARWQIDRRWRLAATYTLNMYLPLEIRTSQTSPRTNMVGEGKSHYPAFEIELLY